MSNLINENAGKSKCNRKHLSLEQRKIILECLKQNLNQEITAKAVGVNKTTISRELYQHRQLFKNRRNPNARCVKLESCSVKHICKDVVCASKCKNCQYFKKCSDICPDFEAFICKKHSRYPYVCDGCSKASTCKHDFYRYDPILADKQSKLVLDRIDPRDVILHPSLIRRHQK